MQDLQCFSLCLCTNVPAVAMNEPGFKHLSNVFSLSLNNVHGSFFRQNSGAVERNRHPKVCRETAQTVYDLKHPRRVHSTFPYAQYSRPLPNTPQASARVQLFQGSATASNRPSGIRQTLWASWHSSSSLSNWATWSSS